MRWLVIVGIGLALTSTVRADLVPVGVEPTALKIRGIWGSGKTTLFVGEGGTIVRTTDDGASWTLPASGTRDTLHAIWGIGKDVHVVGDRGVVLRSTDGGVTWTARTIGNAVTLHAVWGSAPDDVVVAGEAEYLAHSIDRGTTWKPIALGGSATLVGITGTKDDVLVVGRDAVQLRRVKGTWSAQRSTSRTGTVTAVARAGAKDIVLDSRRRVTLMSGATVERESFHRAADVIWSHGGVTIIGGIMQTSRSTDDGVTWTQASLRGVMASAIWGDARTWWLAGNRGSLFRSLDRGLTWTEMSKRTLVSRSEVSSFATDGAAILAAIGTTLARSTDAGATWTTIPKSGVAATRIVETSAGVVAIGFGATDVERTSDGGATWTTIGQLPVDANSVSAFAAHHDTLVVIARNQVAVSSDAGVTWHLHESPIDSALWLWREAAGRWLVTTTSGKTVATTDFATWTPERTRAWKLKRGDLEVAIDAGVVSATTSTSPWVRAPGLTATTAWTDGATILVGTEYGEIWRTR